MQSPKADNQGIYTAEKVSKGTRLMDMHENSKGPVSCQRTREQTNNPLDGNQEGRKSHLSTIRKNFGSLKRNLFSEFNNISNADDSMKKETLEEQNEEKSPKRDIKSTPIKEEVKHSLLEFMSPPPQDPGRFDGSLINCMTPTPLKANNYDEVRPNFPSYNLFRENYQKGGNVPQFIPFQITSKENNFRPFHDTFDSHQIYEELCGQKRVKVENLVLGENPLMTSLIYSPCKSEYSQSSQSSQSTPKLYMRI